MSTDVHAESVDARQSRDETARRIAEELQRYPERCRYAKVTSLLHAFRVPGSHNQIDDMERALSQRGVTVSAGRPGISRRDVLELATQQAPRPQKTQPRDLGGVRLSVWAPGLPGTQRLPLQSAEGLEQQQGDHVLWFDVDAPENPPSSSEFHLKAQEIAGILRPWCPQVNDLIIADLLTPDLQPKIETYGDERTGVRSVSVIAVVAREVPDEEDEFDALDEQLIFQTVEVIVGPGWLITCWHRARTVTGNEAEEVGPPLLQEPFLAHVAHRWVNDPGAGHFDAQKTSSDLATYLARSLVATYDASLRMLQRWVSLWEVDFYKSLSHHQKPKRLKDAAREISNFLSLVGDFNQVVTAFNLAGEEMRNKTWFPDTAAGSSEQKVPGEPAKVLASLVDTAARKLAHVSADIRADMDLLMIQSQAAQQESSEKLQGYLGKVTGLVLVPTFVAGLYGANTALPGGGTWTGFDIMLLLMVVSGLASYLVIRKLMA